MPPKRRRPSLPTLSPEPKKRVTRSSTRQNPSTEQGPKGDSPVAKPSTSRAKSQLKSTKHVTTTTPKPSDASDNIESNPVKQIEPTLPNNITTLTITSTLVKKPIQCQRYKCSNPSTPDSLDTLIFTHGAGGTLSAPAVVNFCAGFSSSLPVFAFQGSSNLPARVQAFHECISHIRTCEQENADAKPRTNKRKIGARGLLIGGRSMGARAAVMAATSFLTETIEETDERPKVRLILVSYPLKGPKGIRDEILLDLSEDVDVLFIIGERDAMCPLDPLEDVRGKMAAVSQLVVVRGADHGMCVRGKDREREVGEETGQVAARWVKEGMSGEVVYVGGKG